MEEYIARLITLNCNALPLLKLLEEIPENKWDHGKELLVAGGKKIKLLELIFGNMRKGEEFFLDFLSVNKPLIDKDLLLSAIEFGMKHSDYQLSYGNMKVSNYISNDVWMNFAKVYLEKQGVDPKEIANRFLDLAIKIDSLGLVELAIKDGGRAGKSVANVKSSEVLNALIVGGESLNEEKDKRKKSVAEIILSRHDAFFKDNRNCKAIRKYVIQNQIDAGEEKQKKLISCLTRTGRSDDVIFCLKKLPQESWMWKLEEDENILIKIIKARVIWDDDFYGEIEKIPKNLWSQKNKFDKSPLNQLFHDSNGFEYLNAGAWIEILKNIDIKKELVPLFMNSDHKLKIKFPLEPCTGNAMFKQWNKELFEGIAQTDCKVLLNSVWQDDLSMSDRNLESRGWMAGLKNLGEKEIQRLNLGGLKFGFELGQELENFRRSCRTNMLLGGGERDFSVELEKIINNGVNVGKDAEMVLKYFSSSLSKLSNSYLYESIKWEAAQRMIEGYILKMGLKVSSESNTKSL